MDGLRSDGEASYLALVKFDHETDLSFKVGGFWSASDRRPARIGMREPR